MDAFEQESNHAAEIPRWLRALLGIPLCLFGGFISVFLGLYLCFYLLSRLAGEHPVPQTLGFLVFWVFFGTAPLWMGILLLRPSPEKTRFWRRMLLGMLVLFVIAAGDGIYGPTNWHLFLRGEKFPGSNAAELKHTIITPHLETEINGGTNVLWCGTFQLAWNEACALTGGDLEFGQEQPMAAALNQHAFTKESLEEGSYVAMAGFVRDNIHDKIEAAIKEKFHGSFKPRFVPDKWITPRPQDIVAYACLYKILNFPVPFERLEEALTFGGAQVPGFGMAKYKKALEKAYAQVSILDYQTEDDFVVELKAKPTGDRLILAKVQPKLTLGETVKYVQQRMGHARAEPMLENALFCPLDRQLGSPRVQKIVASR